MHQAMQTASAEVKKRCSMLIRVPAPPQRRHASAAAESADGVPAPDDPSTSHADAATAEDACKPSQADLHPPVSAATPEDGSSADQDDLELALMAEFDKDSLPDAAVSPSAAHGNASPPSGSPLQDTSKPVTAGKKRRQSASRKQQKSKQRKAAAQADILEALLSETAGLEEAAEPAPAGGLSQQTMQADPAPASEVKERPLQKRSQPRKRVKQPTKQAGQPSKPAEGRKSKQGTLQDAEPKVGGALSLAELEQLTSEVMDWNEQATADLK